MAPQSRALPVLITRPEPQAQRFAHDLTARFGQKLLPIITPLLRSVLLNPAFPSGPFGALILTSETGARAAGQLKAHGLPETAFCVGDRTAEVAAAEGFRPVSADGDAQDLLRLLLAHPSQAPFLHLRGRESRGDVTKALLAQAIPAAEAVVYAQEPAPLTPEAVALLSAPGLVVVPLFSPRTAALFREALEKMEVCADLSLFAMSVAVAEEVKGIKATSLNIALHPTQRDIANSMETALFFA